MRRGVLYAGTAAVVLGLGWFHGRSIGSYDFWDSYRSSWSLVFAGLLCIAAYGFGLPDLTRGWAAAGRAVLAVMGGAIGVSLLQLLSGVPLLPRFVVFTSMGVLVGWFWLCAELATSRTERQAGRARVLAVVTEDEVAALQVELNRNPERPAVIAAVLRIDEAIPTPDDPTPLVTATRASDATVIVLDRLAQEDEHIVAQAALLHEAGVRVRTLTLFYDEWLGKLPMAELERVALMFDIGELHRALYGRVNRLFDIVLGLVGFVPLLAMLPFVVVGDLLANRGPLFYKQLRVGKGGKTFPILKFRTMRPAAEGVLANEWTGEDDPRITPFGRVLRITHLDELPQVVNILKGELSVVGPRPEQPRYVEELVQKLPFYNLRHVVRPGLTGWAQVKYGYAGSESDALQKLQYEFYYLRHQGVLLDLRIVGRTIRSVLGRRGR